MKTGIFKNWRRKAVQLKQNVYALYFAVRDPRVPWYAKVFGGCVIAYALSPIDLIPDFIPVLGYLDDLILLPLGIAFTLKMIPPGILAECRAKAESTQAEDMPQSWTIATAIVMLWVILGSALMLFVANEVFHVLEERDYSKPSNFSTPH